MQAKKEFVSGSEEEENDDKAEQDAVLKGIKYWMGDYEPLKLIKIGHKLIAVITQTWSKLRITLLSHINKEENKVLEVASALRKQIKWLTEIHQGASPSLSKQTSRLHRKLSQTVSQIERG